MQPTIDGLADAVFEWASVAHPMRTDASMYLKMYEEIAEVIRSDGNDPLEIADLFILLLDFAKVKRIAFLGDLIQQKLDINRDRTWQVDSNGVMHHKKETSNENRSVN